MPDVSNRVGSGPWLRRRAMMSAIRASQAAFPESTSVRDVVSMQSRMVICDVSEVGRTCTTVWKDLSVRVSL